MKYSDQIKFKEIKRGDRYSHRYYNENGEISLIYPADHTFYTFEIYCIKGELFDDVLRYETLLEALCAITEFLKTK